MSANGRDDGRHRLHRMARRASFSGERLAGSRTGPARKPSRRPGRRRAGRGIAQRGTRSARACTAPRWSSISPAPLARSSEALHRAKVDADGRSRARGAALGVRLVHTSSLGVTGPGSPTNPPAEDDPLRPINDYGESKRRSEEVVKGIAGLEWTIVRPTLVYGPRDRLFLPLFKLARRGIFPIPNRPRRTTSSMSRMSRAPLNWWGRVRVRRETFFLGDPAT